MDRVPTSLHTTTYIENQALPSYAVRRISDGQFLRDDGKFQLVGEHGKINTYHVDIRTSPDSWTKEGVDLAGCEVVALAEVKVITAVPVTW